MSGDESSLDEFLEEYDDGIVCFGPITESQLERVKRLPRRTVVPSDIKLSQSFIINSNEAQNDDDDKLTLDKMQENSTVHIKDPVDITQLTNNIVEDETSQIEFCKDHSSIFSSPCESEMIPKGKLMDTEVLKRYIRKESISSDESFLEDQNNATFTAEAVSYIDDQEVKLSENNSVCNDTSLCKQLSVTSEIEQNISDKPKDTSDIALNICKLTPFGQEEDTDLSYCNDSVLEEVCEDSIVPDEYYITPGKQRIFDMRFTNPSNRSKIFVSSAPSMDRIEENITPVMTKVLNCPLTSINNSCSTYVTEDDLDASDTGIIKNVSIVDFNQTSEKELESSRVVIETEKTNVSNLLEYDTMDAFSSSENVYHSVSTEVLKNYIYGTENVNMDVEVMSADSISVENKSTYTNKELSDTPLKVVNKTLDDLGTVVNTDGLDNIKNIESVIISETDVVYDNNDKEKLSIAVEVRKSSNDPSVLNTTYGDTCINKLFTNSYNESLNETNQTEDHSKFIKLSDEEKSLDVMSNTTINDKLQPNEFNIDNSLKDLTKLDNSYLDTTEPTYSNMEPTPLEGTSHDMRQYLDFEPVNQSTCCSDVKINELAQENILEHMLCSDVTFTTPATDMENSITDNSSPLKSNLSVIIENRTLEESSCNDMGQNDEVLSTLSTQNKEKYFTSEHSPIPEIQISIANESVNNSEIIEMETKSKGNMVINNLILDDRNIFEQNNVTEISNFAIEEIDSLTRSPNQEQQLELYNDIQQPSSLKKSKNSLEHNEVEKLFNFETEKKVQQFEYNTPKIQKLLDFSIVQQTPTDANKSKKQKLVNFSIVEQTPITKGILQNSVHQTLITKDTLIDFSSVDQIQELESVSSNENSSFNDNFSNNLSMVSAPDIEFFMDESLKTNLSNQSNLNIINTITDIDLNVSTYSDGICKHKTSIDQSTEVLNLESIDHNNCSIKKDESSNSLNKTIQQTEDMELFKTTEISKPKASYLPVTTLKQNAKNFNPSESVVHSNQQLASNSNECVIVDFSIVEQSMLQLSDLNTNIVNKSDGNTTNFIDMTIADTKSNAQVFPSPKISAHKTENSVKLNSDDINETAIQLEESKCCLNDTLLTDIQMDDVSLLIESPRKSSTNESFHSIELDNAEEDNKRKLPLQESFSIEKKMKVETEELKTPMSMLYKIKSMFSNSKKSANCASNTKESELKSDKCFHALSNLENKYNFTMSTSLKKSKIPCILTNKSIIKNDEFNSTSLLNDTIKPKRVIPKLMGVPVLSDVSNSSNKKCPESRIPSKFNK